jgi:peptidyl-prolyl cis-trans isomerase A (cyclophilin A)
VAVREVFPFEATRFAGGYRHRIPNPSLDGHDPMTRLLTLMLLAALALIAASQPGAAQAADEQALTTFRARFETSQGAFVIEVHRDWAPLAADRFYTLVKRGFYNDARFFRVLSGFMAQFGLSGDPKVQSEYAAANLMDEPAKQSNLRGFVSFAKESAPNTRYTMVFINYKDNSYLDTDGFAPFGQVVSGMEIVEKLYSGYGRQNVPDQRRIKSEGNAYLTAEYPKLDFINAARIEATK